MSTTHVFTAASVGGLFDQLVAFFDGRAARVLETMQMPAEGGGIEFSVSFEDVVDEPGETTRIDWQIFLGEIKSRTTRLDANGLPVLA